MALSVYLNQRWLAINRVMWHSSKTNFTWSAKDINLQNEFEKFTLKITSTSLRGQYVHMFVAVNHQYISQKIIWAYQYWSYISTPLFSLPQMLALPNPPPRSSTRSCRRCLVAAVWRSSQRPPTRTCPWLSWCRRRLRLLDSPTVS